MALRLGDKAPDFRAESTQGPIEFHPWLSNSWGIIFWHPTDFTPVCNTEIIATARVQSEFKKRNIKPLFISADPMHDHRSCVSDIKAMLDIEIDFPLISDPNGEIAGLYDLQGKEATTKSAIRTLFIIDPRQEIRLTITYPVTTGRNFYEILRVCDSLQLTEEYLVATPADWYQGQDVFVLPSLSEKEAAEKFPKGIQRINDYSIQTPQPN